MKIVNSQLMTLQLTQKIRFNDDHLKILVLLEIEQLLQANQKSLKDYPSMPYPEDGNWATCLDNSLILSELNYNNDEGSDKCPILLEVLLFD
ncbi:hypothetical protein JHK87_022231 [Glycine soja]|nr:hypothetical protein JHK87_022231 [Glycine soja]